jgi:subtilisin-like proprotein convertase family protein
MKTESIKVLSGVLGALALGLVSASASLSYNYSGLGQTITDGSSVGITSIASVTGAGGIASSGDNVSVTLNLSGGNIGDLVAYLGYGGITVQLLNRPGLNNPSPLGYAGGTTFIFSATLTDTGTTPGTLSTVDSYGGGNVSGVSYVASQGSTAFQAFNGLSSVEGNWTLFFADLSGGDGANVTTLNGWDLDITAVPEPINVALVIFGLGVIGISAVCRHRGSPKTSH